MTLDEAIKHAEEVASECESETDWGMGNAFIDRSGVADIIKRGEENRQLAEWLKELKQLREQTKWIPVSERLPEKSKKHNTFLVTDSDGNLSISKFYLPLSNSDIDQPYWSGMIDVIAWMPLPEPYKAESEEI